jgi:hypothetical protein
MQQALDFTDVCLRANTAEYAPTRQSKLAQILFTFDLAQELEGSGMSERRNVNYAGGRTVFQERQEQIGEQETGEVSSLRSAIRGRRRWSAAPCASRKTSFGRARLAHTDSGQNDEGDLVSR